MPYETPFSASGPSAAVAIEARPEAPPRPRPC